MFSFETFNIVWFGLTLALFWRSESVFWSFGFWSFPYACIFGVLSGGVVFIIWFTVFFTIPMIGLIFCRDDGRYHDHW